MSELYSHLLCTRKDSFQLNHGTSISGTLINVAIWNFRLFVAHCKSAKLIISVLLHAMIGQFAAENNLTFKFYGVFSR